MTITEDGRYRLFRRLEELLGIEEATTLMEHLPPVGWADVATRRDLDHLEASLRSELKQLESNVKAQVADGQRTLVLTFVTSNIALVAVVLAAVRLVI